MKNCTCSFVFRKLMITPQCVVKTIRICIICEHFAEVFGFCAKKHVDRELYYSYNTVEGTVLVE